MVQSQLTRSFAAVRAWRVMTSHQSPCSASRLREGRCCMAWQVLAPGMPNVLSEGFEHEQDIFRIESGRTLLLRKSLDNEALDTGEVVGFGEMLQEPDDRVFIGEIIICC